MQKAVKTLQKFANKAPYLYFFAAFERVHGKELEQTLKTKEKKRERMRRIASGENVSDSSSTKEQKRVKREELL